MEKVILRTNHLTKFYGSFKALDDVSICLKKGHIYGFIGENGSGKTTLMSILTGLAFETSGSYSIMEKDKSTTLQRMIGSTIEGPALYQQYTAYQNLELQRRLIGNPDKGACDEVLKMVNLQDVRDKKVKKFSMGMRQRLSIAMALIGKPNLLILDEPVNGLDPKNISELRKLLQKLNDEQKVTMLISSHILGELYQLASDFIIIHKGKIVESLSHEELTAKCQKYVRIKTDELLKCVTVIEKELGIHDYKIIDDTTICIYDLIHETERISKAFIQNGIVIRELSVSEQSLEDYFLSVTGGAWNV